MLEFIHFKTITKKL